MTRPFPRAAGADRLVGALVVRSDGWLDLDAVRQQAASVRIAGESPPAPVTRAPAVWSEALPWPAGDERSAAMRARIGQRPFHAHAEARVRVCLFHYPDGVQDLLVAAPASVLDEAGLAGLVLRLVGKDNAPVLLRAPVALGGEPATARPAWAMPVPAGPERRLVEESGLVAADANDDAAVRVLGALGMALARRESVGSASVSLRRPGVARLDLALADDLRIVPFPARLAHRASEARDLARSALNAGTATDTAAGFAELVLPMATATREHLQRAKLTLIERWSARSEVPLRLILDRCLSGHRVRCDYRADIFAPEVVRDFLIEVCRLAAKPSQSRRGAGPVTQGAGSAVPHTTGPAQDPRTVYELVDGHIAHRPEAVAVAMGEERLSYGQLGERADEVAQVVAAQGFGRGDLIGISLPRGPDLVATMLGVLKAGAAYVPMDPTYPPDRLQFIADDARISLLFAEGGHASVQGPPVLAPRGSSLARAAAGLEHDAPSSTDTAYVIYTSGTTGRPKGVVVEHRNVTALLDATQGELSFDHDDVWTAFHSYSFDFSVWEIWMCLATGGRLVIVPSDEARSPDALVGILHRERVTVLSQTPSAFAQLMSADLGDLAHADLRLVVFGGEALPARSLLPWFDIVPERTCRVVNMYGITETTVHCTWQTVTRQEALEDSRSIGRPLPGWTLSIRDAAGRPVPNGVAGEIYVGGRGVARGYHGRPGLTARRFAPDDRAEAPGARLYRSGDRGRRLSDGSFEHLGRLDSQVQIRGYRIELDEIRHRLLEQPGVQAAAVTVNRRGSAGDLHIDAFVVGAGAHLDTVQAGIARHLPEFMVPSTISVLRRLPTTSNGKLDVTRLTGPEPDRSTAFPPGPFPHEPLARTHGDELVDRLIRICQDVLGLPVGADDNFFELGGNSLLAVRVMKALRGDGITEEPVRVLYLHPTPRALAAALAPPPVDR